MIIHLKVKNLVDVYEFLSHTKDFFEDFYITKEKNRHFLKNNWSLIKKILETQECYGLFNNGLKGLLLIYRDKNFRPYVKLLVQNSKFTIDMLKFLRWNFFEQTLFFKLKKENPLSTMILKTGFVKIGDRGKELLFEKRGMKQLYPLTPKDNYLINEEKKLY